MTLKQRLTRLLTEASRQSGDAMSEQQVLQMLGRMAAVLDAQEKARLKAALEVLAKGVEQRVRPEVTEVRPRELECDVVRFQNNKDKWVALVGMLDG